MRKVATKIRHKGSAWSHHGKRGGLREMAIRINRETRERRAMVLRRRGRMYASVAELMRSAGRP